MGSVNLYYINQPQQPCFVSKLTTMSIHERINLKALLGNIAEPQLRPAPGGPRVFLCVEVSPYGPVQCGTDFENEIVYAATLTELAYLVSIEEHAYRSFWLLGRVVI